MDSGMIVGRSAMKICINCGKELLDTAKYCIYCNARQPEAEEGKVKVIVKSEKFAPAIVLISHHNQKI